MIAQAAREDHLEGFNKGRRERPNPRAQQRKRTANGQTSGVFSGGMCCSLARGKRPHFSVSRSSSRSFCFGFSSGSKSSATELMQ